MSAARELGQLVSEHPVSDWLSPTEAAVYLRIFNKDGSPAVGTVRKLVCQGRLPKYKPFGRLLFKRSELQQIVEKSKNAGGR